VAWNGILVKRSRACSTTANADLGWGPIVLIVAMSATIAAAATGASRIQGRRRGVGSMRSGARSS
jgi:hypothetical protein